MPATRTFPRQAIAAALALLLAPASALCVDFIDDGLAYVFQSGSDTEVVVVGLADYSITHISIPATVQCNSQTYRVTSIGQQAFYNRSGLTSVTIANSVTSIGDYAFCGCSGLASVTIPDSVTDIGNSAFSSCGGLTSVTIGNSVTSIGNEAFAYCSSLASVTIPDSVTSIGKNAFYICSGLTRVTIGDSVTSIGTSAFYGCSGLTNATVLGNVANDWSASDAPFSGCTNLATIVLGEKMTKIGDYMFYGCSGLASVAIPDSVTSIGDYAFSGCSGLTSVTIPDSVVSFPTTAFDGCDRLWTAWYRTLANLSAGGGGGSGNGGSGGGGSPQTVSLTVTNVVVHYVTQSIPSGAVTPSTNSTGIVNIIAEVTAPKAIAITEDWARQYPGFEAAFGTDFSAALTMETGKRDGAGNPMFVWQDFVAGTDPTDPASVFTATLAFDAATGTPIVSWSPELSPAEAAKRKYTVSAKKRITDPDWIPLDGDAATCNFFRVTVEMR
jgi:hypothetical protein